MPGKPLHKILLGLTIACLESGNLAFSWFRSFDWLHKNSPAVWGVMAKPEFQQMLIFLALVYSGAGLRELYKHRSDADKGARGLQEASRLKATTAGEKSPALTAHTLHIGGDLVMAGGANKVNAIDREFPVVILRYDEVGIKPPEWNGREHITHVFPESELLAINDSDQNAYEVTLLPADFRGYCVNGYKSIDIGKRSSVRLPYRVIRQDRNDPAMGHPDFEFEHNLRPLLKRVSAQNEELVTLFSIRYKDSAGRGYSNTFNLVYHNRQYPDVPPAITITSGPKAD